MYCCFSRDLSVRCSMLKEMPLLRAPENKRTGMEIRPKVKCPDQTEAAIIPLPRLVIPTKQMDWRQPIHLRVEEPAVSRRLRYTMEPPKLPRIGSLAYKRSLFAQILGHGEPKCEAGGNG